jgi:hypothetical protein
MTGPAGEQTRARYRMSPAASSVTACSAGHGPHARDPVKVSLLLRDFAARAAGLR